MKLKTKESLTLKTLFPDINKAFSDRENVSILKTAITEQIYSGKSPVAGERFVKYSDGYAKLKGKKAPVDMALSGEMLSSLRATNKEAGSITLYFNSKIAKFHDLLGAGKSKVIRRLLPRKNGERFVDRINKLIFSIAQKAIDKATRKQNN